MSRPLSGGDIKKLINKSSNVNKTKSHQSGQITEHKHRSESVEVVLLRVYILDKSAREGWFCSH
jgi:hypothetical protein